MTTQLAEALKLPVPERIKLVEDIWDSIALDTGAVRLTREQRVELERRMADYQQNPHGNIPWEQIKAEALACN